MREMKYIKFRVDMPDDTKFKIIDRRPERDLIHYVWYRIVLLCGKVNLYGELYMSKNIPYTVETLAIEFNRDIDQVKIALDVLMELEMIVVNEHNVYCVKNFAKHQNIKVKEKEEFNKDFKVDNNENQASNENDKVKNIEDIRKDKIHQKDNKSQNEFDKSKPQGIIDGNGKNNLEIAIDSEKDKINLNEQSQNKISEIDIKAATTSKADILEITNEVIKSEDNISNHKDNSIIVETTPISLKPKKNKKSSKKKKEEEIYTITAEDEDDDDCEPVCYLTEGEPVLGEGEVIVRSFIFK